MVSSGRGRMGSRTDQQVRLETFDEAYVLFEQRVPRHLLIDFGLVADALGLERIVESRECLLKI